MSTGIKQAAEMALKLNPEEKVRLIDTVIMSLDHPDPALDVSWQKEVEARIEAYESDEMNTLDWEDVRAEIEKRLPKRSK
jgi:putative addiction module component (TIGR02574 family)